MPSPKRILPCPRFFRWFLSLLNQTYHASKGFGLRSFAEKLESGFQPLDVPFGLPEMFIQQFFELWVNWYGISVLRMVGLAWDIKSPRFYGLHEDHSLRTSGLHT
jgi:hypothetical protein